MDTKFAAMALDTYLLTDTFEQDVYGCGLPKDFVEYMVRAWKRNLIYMLGVTGQELIDNALNHLLEGFRDEQDTIDFYNVVSDRDLAFFDGYGYSISPTLLKQAIDIKWSKNENLESSAA